MFSDKRAASPAPLPALKRDGYESRTFEGSPGAGVGIGWADVSSGVSVCTGIAGVLPVVCPMEAAVVAGIIVCSPETVVVTGVIVCAMETAAVAVTVAGLWGCEVMVTEGGTV